MTRLAALFLVIVPTLLSVPLGATAPAAARLEPVSPGAPDVPLVEGKTCPTFSWAASQPAKSFRIRAARVPEAGSVPFPDALPESLSVAIDVSVPGGARSWTPSAENCLERGGSYVWFVQSELDGDPVEISPGYFFRVPETPSSAEVAWARDILSRHIGPFHEPSVDSSGRAESRGAPALERSPTSLAGNGAAVPSGAVASLATDNVALSIDGILEARGLRAVASESADGDIEAEGNIVLQESVVESPGQIITATTFGTNGERDDLVRLSSPEQGTVLVTQPGGSTRAGELQLAHLHARSEVRADGGIRLSGSAWTGSDGGVGVS